MSEEGRTRTVFIGDSDTGLRKAMAALLRSHGFAVTEWPFTEPAARLAASRKIDICVLGSSPPGSADALEVAAQIRRSNRAIPIILIAGDGSEERAISAIRAGVNDYLRCADALKGLLASIERCSRDLGEAAPDLGSCDAMIGQSEQIRKVKAHLLQIAATDTTVLITGSTGTGKELVAELIHRNGARRRRPLVSVNAAAIPDSLLESELFGYETGAFTGAVGSREGKLEQADGGTVFLDEIGDMSLFAQAKVLRAIENKEVQRLGARNGHPVNIRIVAATNRDLETSIAEGRFRQDLYFRLNVARIHLPALRDRKEDLPALIRHFVAAFSLRFHRKVEGLAGPTLDYAMRYDWPGNVRELKNFLEAAFVEMPPGESLLSMPEHYRRRVYSVEAPVRNERDRLVATLLSTNWNKSETARKLNWSRMTLYRKLAKHCISLEVAAL